MIKPRWVPSGIKGLRASAATLRDEDLTIALPSHGRFECDFEAMYAIRVLQRQSRWYAILDGATRFVQLVSASVFIAALCLEHFDLAVYAGAVVMATLSMQAMVRPGQQLAECLRLRNAFVAVRSDAARLTDRQYRHRLHELQTPNRVTIWRWLARSAFSEVCRDLGCSDAPPVTRAPGPNPANISNAGSTHRVPR